MNIFSCCRKGLVEAAARPRIILILWAVNAMFASLAFVMFSGFVGSSLGRSTAAAGLMTKTDMNIIIEMLVSPQSGMNILRPGLLALIFLFCLVSIFLQGGILRGLFDVSDEARGSRLFFEGGARYYWRFFRLAVYSTILWVPALLVSAAVYGALTSAARNSINEQLVFCLRIGVGVMTLFLVYFVMMIMDYARIRIVSEGSRKVFRPLALSTVFVFRHLGSSLGIYYLLGAAGLILFIVWRLTVQAVPATSAAAVWAAFFLTQIFIMSRGWLRIAFQSAQAANFTARSQAVKAAGEPVREDGAAAGTPGAGPSI